MKIFWWTATTLEFSIKQPSVVICRIHPENSITNNKDKFKMPWTKSLLVDWWEVFWCTASGIEYKDQKTLSTSTNFYIDSCKACLFLLKIYLFDHASWYPCINGIKQITRWRYFDIRLYLYSWVSNKINPLH